VTTSSSITAGGGSAWHAIDDRARAVSDAAIFAATLSVNGRPPLATVLDAADLAGRARQRAGGDDANIRGYANVVLEFSREQRGFGLKCIITNFRTAFYDY
jgi:hypothetical protein